MKTTAFLTAVLCTLVAARADITLVQESDMAGLKTKTTMSIKGSKIRTDGGPDASVIIDTDAGTMTTLMHTQKMVMTMKTQDLQAAAKAVTGETAKIDAPKLVPTGKKEKIQGHDCEVYTWEVSGTKSTMWVAKDYPGYAKLKKELAPMARMGGPNAAPSEVDGMVLKTETLANGMKIVTNFVSLKDEPVKDSLFEVPAGYQKVGQ